VRLTWERHFVIRTCGLYGAAGSAGKGGNFVETMLRKANEGAPIRVVDDQVLTPAFTGDSAEAVSKLIRTEAYGLYHVTAEEVLSIICLPSPPQLSRTETRSAGAGSATPRQHHSDRR